MIISKLAQPVANMSDTQNIPSKYEEGLYWLPRALAMIGILIMLLFSYESLWDSYNLSGWELIVYSHVLPAILIGVALYIGWKYEGMGAFSFIILSVMSMIVLEAGNSFSALLFVAFPLLLIGVLFLIHGSEYDLSIRTKTMHT